MQEEPATRFVRPQKRQIQREKNIPEDEALIHILKEKLAKRKHDSTDKQDEDTLFMLSLVPELKKIPDHARLQIKSELLTCIINAQKFYSAYPSTSSSQIGLVQNYSALGQYYDPAYHGNMQSNQGPSQLPPVPSPTGTEYSEESLLYNL